MGGWQVHYLHLTTVNYSATVRDARMSRQPELGQRLKDMRRARGLRQSDLAGGKVTVAYISMVEAGKRSPGLEVLTHLAQRLGCSVTELQGGPTADQLAGRRLRVDYGELALHNGDHAEALLAADDVLAAIRVAGSADPDDELTMRVRWIKGRALELAGQFEAAAPLLAEVYAEVSSSARDTSTSNPVLAMQVALVWARCLNELADVAAANQVVVEARDEAAKAGLQGTDGYAELTSTHMAMLYSLNDIDGAGRVAEELIGLVEASGTRRARAAAYWNAAGVSEARGDLPGALAMSERAVALLAEDDDERMLARARTACAWFMLRAEPSRAPEALDLLSKARATLELTGSAIDLAYTRVESGQALLLLGRPAQALAEAEAAVELIGERLLAESASAWLVQATAQVALGQADQARISSARAESCLRELPVSRSTAMSFRELGQVHELLGDATLALAAYRTALDLTAYAGSPAGAAAQQTTKEEVR